MSVDRALAQLARLIEAADVVPRMRWADPDAGAAPSLAEYPEGPEAAFELAPGSAEDGGQLGCLPARVRLTVRWRTRYRIAGSRQATLAQMQRDWVAVRNATMFSPTAWEQGTTGIGLILLGPMTFEGPMLAPGQTSPRHVAMAADFIVEIDQ